MSLATDEIKKIHQHLDNILRDSADKKECKEIEIKIVINEGGIRSWFTTQKTKMK